MNVTLRVHFPSKKTVIEKDFDWDSEPAFRNMMHVPSQLLLGVYTSATARTAKFWADRVWFDGEKIKDRTGPVAHPKTCGGLGCGRKGCIDCILRA